jgi:hypothetical protein
MFDHIDAHTNKPVWHGWAKKELNQSDIDASIPVQAGIERRSQSAGGGTVGKKERPQRRGR